jgi:hypothetical protein
MKTLTIDRATWRRGGAPEFGNTTAVGYGSTSLLNEHGYKCCLGFDALACGLTEKDILGVQVPEGLFRHILPAEYRATRLRKPDVANWSTDPVPAVQDAINANDATDVTDAVREASVTRALLALGWDEVAFVN